MGTRDQQEEPTQAEARDVRGDVQRAYGAIACEPELGPTCGADGYSSAIGYSDEELAAVPDGANLGLGCGNPTALAALALGETVVDLGSGAGFDAFLAADRVGDAGHVIGVDMTDEMLEKARANAEKAGRVNVEFRKGFIEELPIDDGSVDAVISNCVINLSPDKARVFAEVFRVLKPGGRLFVSDIVLGEALPEALRGQIEAYVGCVAGGIPRADYLAIVAAAGFTDVRVVGEKTFGPMLHEQFPELVSAAERAGLAAADIERAANAVLSAQVTATKPTQ